MLNFERVPRLARRRRASRAARHGCAAARQSRGTPSIAIVTAVALSIAAAAAPPDEPDVVTIGDRALVLREWPAGTVVGDAGDEAALGMDRSGRVVIVWAGPRPDGRGGIYGRVYFQVEGQAPGDEMLLSIGPSQHESPSVAMDAEGRTWLAWRMKPSPNVPASIVARRLSESLSGTHAFPVTDDDGSDASEPVVAAGTDGRAFIAWTSRREGEKPRVRARVLWTDVQPVGGEALIRRGDGLARHSPSVATDPSGGFVLVYAVGEPGEEQSVVMERFTVSGGRRGVPLTISDPGAPGPADPVVAAAGDSFVVAWRQTAGERQAVMMTRRVGPNGRLGPVATLGAESGGALGAAAVAASDDGRSAVAFNATGAAGVFIQLFQPDGSPQGACALLAPRAESTRAWLPASGTTRLSLGGDGTIAAAWIATSADDGVAYLTVLSPVPADQ